MKMEDLVRGEYMRSPDGAEPSYLLTPWGEKVSRARVLGTVVDKFIRDDRSYAALRLDDGSATIRVRAWAEGVPELDRFNIGESLDVIGRVREYQGEVYLVPEPGLVMPVKDPNLQTLRELEIVKIKKDALARGVRPGVRSGLHEVAVGFGSAAAEEAAPQMPEVPEELKNRTAAAAEKLGEEDGVTLDELAAELKVSRKEAQDAVRALLVDGQLFEPKPGRFKVVR
ncbi:MAG: OB-fold nucleic acid binding domain-containing protein [Candidatus Hadarchaeota archaeon]